MEKYGKKMMQMQSNLSKIIIENDSQVNTEKVYIKRVSDKTIEWLKTYPYFIRNDLTSFNDKSIVMSEVQSEKILQFLGYDLSTYIVRGNELQNAIKHRNWAFDFSKMVDGKNKKLRLEGIDEPDVSLKVMVSIQNGDRKLSQLLGWYEFWIEDGIVYKRSYGILM